MEKPLLLFDGMCNLCTGSVQFIIKRDPTAKLSFAALQSKVGQHILEQFNLPQNELKSLVFYENGKVYTRSTGALRVAKHLSGLWPLLYVLMLFPRFIRDAVYDWVGRNRYRWFGKKTTCWMPTPELNSRFRF